MAGIKRGVQYLVQFVVVLYKAALAEDWEVVKVLVPILKLWISEATGLPNVATTAISIVKDIKVIDVGWRYLIGRDPFKESHDAFVIVLRLPEVAKYLE
jgi:hypothetical protein